MRALLDEIARSEQASFLAVIKTFGDRPSPGMLSFPRAGATLALDLPNRGEETLTSYGGWTRSCAEPAALSIRQRMGECQRPCSDQAIRAGKRSPHTRILTSALTFGEG